MRNPAVLFVSTLCLLFSPRIAEAQSLADVNQRFASGAPTRIACFGDSITGVYYHTGGKRAWCDMLGLALQKANPHANLEMINAGISGHTTVNALARIQKDVIAKSPHLVVVMFGMNDVVGVPLDTYRKNMRSIVKQCQDAGSAVVLCTPNPVSPTPRRPEKKLVTYVDAVRAIASEQQLPLVDCFDDFASLREQDRNAWLLLMSDEIHPNMTGHIRFAELMTKTICGDDTSISDTLPPLDALQHTFDRLSKNEPVKLVAMAPYDTLIPNVLAKHFPEAKFEVTTWPTTEKSSEQLAEWAKRIRKMNPNLVVPAVPVECTATEPEAFLRDYDWVLNHSLPFSGRAWDLVPVLPMVDTKLSAEQESQVAIGRAIIRSKDMAFIERADSNVSAIDTVTAWVTRQLKTWQATRNHLPEQNTALHLPVQSWPQNPGPRTARILVTYPGGEIKNVNEQTGVMLTLHNWGGIDCVGTANPKALADRLNVIAICVNYLQSGPTPSIHSPEPYDFGYLQALDALRAMAYVRSGLKQAGITYDDRRLFCTGGSGGGNVTLMANKLAPRTFACIIDKCGMKKLSDDIAFNVPGGSFLNARWSRDPASRNYLTADEQSLRYLSNPKHLAITKALNPEAKMIVVHGTEDVVCPFADAEEFVANLQAAEFDVEHHFIAKEDLDGAVFTSTGHALGNRTEIVFEVAGDYLMPDSPKALRRSGPSDFERREKVVYPTPNGQFIIDYSSGYPIGSFQPGHPG